jgi:YidC/Oxa1 family membrane protein insertase
MENMRLILILALAFVLFLIYQAWVEDYSTPPVASTETETFAGRSAADAPGGAPADAPNAPAVGAPTVNAVPGAFAADQAAGAALAAGPIVVETDVLRAEISPRGGTIQALYLLDYKQNADDPSQPFQLLKATTPNLFIVQSGLLGGADNDLPTHEAVFTPAQQRYSLTEDDNELLVELFWQNDAGIQVVKRYRFERGRFLVHASQEIINGTETPIAVRDYE